jgi:hypothetical protein
MKKRLLQQGGLFIAILAIVFISFDVRKQRDVTRRRLYGGVNEFIETQTKPDEVIGFFASDRSYLFYGKKLDRKVIYVPPTMMQNAEWIEQLQKQKIDLVAIGPITHEPRISEKEALETLKWLDSSESPMVRVFGVDKNPLRSTMIYRFKPVSDKKSQ